MATTPACKVARDEIRDLKYEDLENGVPIKTFFPLDRLRACLTDSTQDQVGKIENILRCNCADCRSDAAIFNSPDPDAYIARVAGRRSNRDELTASALGLFALLIYNEHPLFIIGFLDNGCNDYLLELSATSPNYFSRENLQRYTEPYHVRNSNGFRRFASEFASSVSKFAIPHMTSDDFVSFHKDAILPFVDEKEIGRKIGSQGNWTSEGSNGRVYAFKIYEEYRKFPHTGKLRDFARKKIETPEVIAHLEKEVLQNVRRYRDDHIVKLIKSYRLGNSINLIFPLARTNLDHLLRDHVFDYGKQRAGPLESCDAWLQLLGIAKALRKIQGEDGSSDAKVSERLCIHFDLKPDNILVEKSGTWVITDFGQAALTYPKFGGTPRVANHWGTDGYAPPEIDNIDVECGRKYDIWSLGCIFLEVTAFVVLGYAGLTGATELGKSFPGLDQARGETSPWSRNVADERFFYRAPPSGAYVVKKAINSFIEFLEYRVKIGIDNSERSKAFLAKVVHLIHRMLQPDVGNRIDIVGVVRELSNAIQQAAPSTSVTGVPQMAPAEGESVIGGPQLNSIKLWHLSEITREWEGTSLEAFEDDAGNMRLYCWKHNQPPSNSNFRRDHVKIVPHYAFWEQSRSPSGPWMQILNLSKAQPSKVYGTRFSFSGTSALEDARTVQSRLTSQHIAGSFALASVTLKRYVTTTEKVWNSTLRKLGSSRAELKADELTPIVRLGSATIQLWTEQIDAAAVRRRRRQSGMSGATNSNREVRVDPQFESGYREIPPRRAVMYLHRHSFVCTIKMDVNWVLEKHRTKPNVLFFLPHDPSRNPHFVASWVRPTQEELSADYPAGLPLDPAALLYLEDLDRFEADRFELVFITSEAREQFWAKYMDVKMEWDLMRQEMEKTQGYIPVNRRPNHYPHPDLSNATLIERPKRKARFSYKTPSLATHTEDLSHAPVLDKGKAKVTENLDTHQDIAPNIQYLAPPSSNMAVLRQPPTRGVHSRSSSLPGSGDVQHYRGGHGRGIGSGPPRARKPG